MEDERTCTMCGCILQEHEQTEIDEEWLCDECAEQHTTTCDHCGKTIWANDSISDDRTTLCSCCFEDHYRRCEGCGRILHNHPFRGHAEIDFALAHNGVLYNDELLRSQLRLPDTYIETDSYIAVQLIESQKELSFDSLRFAAEQVRGYFTFTILDRRNTLFFVKGESPLYLIHFPALGLYVYSSTKEIMAAAFKQIPAQFPKYEVIDLKEGELLRIAPNGKIIRSSYTVQDDYTLYSGRWYGLGSSFYNWDKAIPTGCSDDSDYLILIELAGYYGVDPEDIRYMRNYNRKALPSGRLWR